MKVRYRLLPGHVRSANDRDVHFIDAPTLARLYGVRMGECLVGESKFGDPPGLIDLFPRRDGNYLTPVPPPEEWTLGRTSIRGESLLQIGEQGRSNSRSIQLPTNVVEHIIAAVQRPPASGCTCPWSVHEPGCPCL
jgi:hypothetical protein